MALNFPNSPTLNQIYTDTTSGFSYQWNGTVWISFSAASSNQIRVLDDISGSFTGIAFTFALTSSSVSISPPNKQSLIINLGGVIQDPSDDYSISGSNITFSTAPTNGLSFSGVSLGPAIPVTLTTIPDGTVTSGSLTVAGLLSTTNLFVSGISTFVGLATHTGTIFGSNLSLTGIATASSFVGTLTGTATGLSGSPNITVTGVNASGVITATSFVGSGANLTGISSVSFATTSFGLSGSPNITVGNIVGTAATLTTLNGTSGLVSVGTTIKVKGFVETQSTVSIAGTILTLDASQGTIFTHTTSAQIGIVSFTGIRTDSAGAQTFSVLVTQGATPRNTTGATGIGTQLASIRITPGNVGYSTHIKVGGGTSITLTGSAGAFDLLTFIVSYDGNTSIGNTSFTVVGFAATDFRNTVV